MGRDSKREQVGGIMDKEQKAMERLRLAAEMSERYYDAPLIVTDSGGKDSAVCIQLAKNAGINFGVQHNHTTADAPETVRHIRERFNALESEGVPCRINHPVYKGKAVSMWSLIPQKLLPPTRVVRYCCDILKEQGGKDRFICTGVRWAESAKRAKRRNAFETLNKDKEKNVLLGDNDDKRLLFENCRLQAKRVVNPIIDWTDEDVWDYIAEQKIEVNSLYCEGFKRVGCIGCPLAGKRHRIIEFNRWPKYKELYIAAFDRMLAERSRRGKLDGTWRMGNTGLDVFNWWMEFDVLPGQFSLDDLEDDDT